MPEEESSTTLAPSSPPSMMPTTWNIPPTPILSVNVQGLSVQAFGDLYNVALTDRINRWGQGFVGTIPTEIGWLTNLAWLNIHSNSILGTIPSELGLLTKLTYLSVTHNQLTGTLPTELGLLTLLTTFNFMENSITGDVPQNFCSINFRRFFTSHGEQYCWIDEDEVGQPGVCDCA